MDTLDSQIIIDDHTIHPETNAAQVIYGNTTAKDMMDGVLSSANLSTAVKNLLQSSNYTEACRALKVTPETYFDECFNAWVGVGSPTVSNAVLNLDGSQYIYSADTFTLGEYFTIQFAFKTTDTSTFQCIADVYVSTNKRIIFDVNAGTIRVNIATNGTNHYSSTANISANTVYFVELNRDYNNNIWRLFVNGSLVGTMTTSYSPTANTAHKVYLGATYVPGRQLSGSINEFRLSNCVRHTAAHTANGANYFTLDDDTLSLMHFD